MAVLAPMPSASVKTATAANPGLWDSVRAAYRRSWESRDTTTLLSAIGRWKRKKVPGKRNFWEGFSSKPKKDQGRRRISHAGDADSPGERRQDLRHRRRRNACSLEHSPGCEPRRSHFDCSAVGVR